MKKLILFSIISLFIQVSFSQTNENISLDSVRTSYYLIRHAEKDLSNPSNKNPGLSEIGFRHAKQWAEMFSEIKFDAIYSTNYKRTLQTAEPIAINQNIEIKIYNPRTINFQDFKKETKGMKILIVGHSNTTPNFTNELLNDEKYDQIDDSIYSNLYVVTIVGNKIKSSLQTDN